jgi:hypothetical protein
MRKIAGPFLGALLGGLACSSAGSPPLDGAASPVSPDGPMADGPGGVAALPSFYLSWSTSAVGDAGDPVSKREISVDSSNGQLYFYETGGAPEDSTMTEAEQKAYAALVGRAGVYAELVSKTPCGPAGADYNEYLSIGTGDGTTTKEITSCQQPAYRDLRQFLLGLIMAHFRFPGGSCPAPNIWRYVNPGCGPDAHPLCGSAFGDGCAAVRCSCTGNDIIGCDFTTEPYAHAGPCHDSAM